MVARTAAEVPEKNKKRSVKSASSRVKRRKKSVALKAKAARGRSY